MALRTARRLVVRGRPPGRAAGRTGATKAHAASVRSVSYNRVLIVRSLWPDQRSSRQTSTFQTPLKPIEFSHEHHIVGTFARGS